jgi:CRISPR-associated endoribonuclease Cas6
LKNKGAFVPFHHQFLLAQLIKGIIIKGGNEKYQNFVFYNFSGLKGQTKISRNGLHFFSNKVTLVLSCLEKDFIDYIIDEMFKMPNVEIGNLVLIPESVEIEKAPELTDVSKFICISPLVLIKPSFNDNESKRFVPPESDEFSDRLFESTILRMESLGTYSLEDMERFKKFQFDPDLKYLQKIKETQKKFARIYPVFDQDVKYEVRGYTLPFTLYAAREVQEFVFTCGLGAFAHKGFGMLDIANSDPTNRTLEYRKKANSSAGSVAKSSVADDHISAQ